MTTETKAKLFATREMYEKVLSDMGVASKVQSGFLKVEPVEGRRMYVPTTKTVRRVDLAGWEHGLGSLTKVPDQGVFGQVRQQMRCGQGAEQDIRNFTALLSHLLTLSPVEKEAKAPKAPKASQPTVVAPVPSSPEVEAAKLEAKRQLILKVAREKGVPVSKKSPFYTLLTSSPEATAQV